VDTVYIVDKQIDKQNKFHLLHKISDQEALKNSANLSDVLRFQTPIYIKENGKGAVSSP
jgi:iron complex outermembrane receptor protein